MSFSAATFQAVRAGSRRATPLLPLLRPSRGPVSGSIPAAQARQKHKKAGADSKTIHVELLHPVDGYGRAGTVIAAPRGLMRNRWFPNGLAAYLSPARLQQLRALEATGEVAFGRDPAFNTESFLREQEQAVHIENTTLEIPSPSRSRELIAAVLARGLTFSRPAITAAAGRAVEWAADVPAGTPLYGSVSTADVAKAVSAALAAAAAAEPDRMADAARITVPAHDVSFPAVEREAADRAAQQLRGAGAGAAAGAGGAGAGRRRGAAGSVVADRIRKTGVFETLVQVRIPSQYAATTTEPVAPVSFQLEIVHEIKSEVEEDEGENEDAEFVTEDGAAAENKPAA